MKLGLFMGLAIMASMALGAQPEVAVECNEGVIGEPVGLEFGAHTTSCAIQPATDLDRFEFTGTIGETIRLNLFSSTSSTMAPIMEIRDPLGSVIASDSCTTSFCSFSLDLNLPLSGAYTVFVSDIGTNNTGNYTLQLERILPGYLPQLLEYDSSVVDSITPQTDVDRFTFNASFGTEIRLNVVSTTSSTLAPVVEIRDPNGTVIIDGALDGASCNTSFCSFSIDLTPSLSGTYSMLLYDLDVNNSGDYQVSIWCLVGSCDSDGNGIPDPDTQLLSYATPVTDSIDPAVDGDFFRFNAPANAELRLNVVSTTSSTLAPVVEIRDPNGTVIIDGALDGASCNTSFCSFSIDLIPVMAGIYSMVLSDVGTNHTGNYQVSLWCLAGDCDSDADGVIDGDPPVLQYGGANTAIDSINPAVDGDFYLFGGTTGDLIRLNVLSTTSSTLAPVVEIRDPNGVIFVNGVVDGASCNTSFCSFTLDLTPTSSGNYTLVIYDLDTNHTGNYQISLQCLIGACVDAVHTGGDNCTDAPNGPLIPDSGGNIQLDTDGDGYGNVCDADFNNDCVVDAFDIPLFRGAFGSSAADQDLNGDSIVDAFDIPIFRTSFGGSPGPSAIGPCVP